jgi:serine/threonine protein phosphatase PrpC
LKIADYHITIGNVTDKGKVREENEDYMAHFNTPLGYCIIVCDGMGGHVAGQFAAQHAVLAIRQYLQDSANSKKDTAHCLKDAIEFANFQLKEFVASNTALEGMGTTCVLALIKSGSLYIAHAGDSRLYILRRKKIKQYTRDHSSVQQLIDIGLMTELEAEHSEKKNQIVKAIGVFDKVLPTVTERPVALRKNDKILLCSDGLTVHVNKNQIADTLISISDTQKACLKLTALANESGGTDNITVQLIHYTGKSFREKSKLSKKKKLIACLLIIAVISSLSFGYFRVFNNKAKTGKNNTEQNLKNTSENEKNSKKTEMK